MVKSGRYYVRFTVSVGIPSVGIDVVPKSKNSLWRWNGNYLRGGHYGVLQTNLSAFLLPLYQRDLVSSKTHLIVLVDWCLMALAAQAGYIVPQEYEIYYVGPGDNNTMKQYTKLKSHLRPGLCGDNPSPHFLRGVFLANHLASTDNLTTTKWQNSYKCKLMRHKKGP